jgi:hypothetical protein
MSSTNVFAPLSSYKKEASTRLKDSPEAPRVKTFDLKLDSSGRTPLDVLSARAVADLLKLPPTELARQNRGLLADMYNRGLLDVIDRATFEARLAKLRSAEREAMESRKKANGLTAPPAEPITLWRIADSIDSLNRMAAIWRDLVRHLKHHLIRSEDPHSVDFQARQRRWFAAEAVRDFTVSEIGYIRPTAAAKKLLGDLSSALIAMPGLKNLSQLEAYIAANSHR